jgi:hypothetical protein
MVRAGWLFFALLLASACSKAGANTPPPRPHQMVVVELFESQGCSSCPPANANVNALSNRPDLLTLIYGVTYWDQLGWTDTFARPEFTARQRDYARGLGNANVYTPQVVLNGRADLVGNDRAQLDAAIQRAASTPFSATVSIAGDTVDMSGQRPSSLQADIWLVRYDPRTLNVPIRAGENRGRTLPHIHVVREVRRLGSWDGAQHSYRIPEPSQTGLSFAILVQAPNGGPIIGAANAPAQAGPG